MYEKKGTPWLSGQIKKCQIDCSKDYNVKMKSNVSKYEGENIQGNKWDRAGLQEILSGDHKKLFVGKSKFQDIKVVKATDIRMYLDGQLQFSSLDERLYHEAFVHIPFTLVESHKRILILGGGDGLALREVLKYSDVRCINLVDLDDKVLNVARNVPEIVALNDGAFFDKRVDVYTMDALEFINNCKKTYDIIIIDFPDPTDEILANLYTKEMFEMLDYILSEDGMIVCQSNSPDETPTVFWSIGRTMEAANYYTKGYHTIVPSFGDWGFHLAAKQPFSIQFNNINVPHRTLPRNPEELFKFTKKCLNYKHFAEVNSKNRLVLHKIFKNEVDDFY